MLNDHADTQRDQLGGQQDLDDSPGVDFQAGLTRGQAHGEDERRERDAQKGHNEHQPHCVGQVALGQSDKGRGGRCDWDGGHDQQADDDVGAKRQALQREDEHGRNDEEICHQAA